MSIPTDIKSGAIFSQLQTGLASFPAVAKEVAEETNKVFQFQIKGGAKPYFFIVDLKNNPSLSFSTSKGDADCTITMSDADFVDLTEGRLDGMSAFMQGKLQIAGDMMAAQAFAPAIQKIREEVAKAGGAQGGSGTSAGDSFPSDIKSAATFKQIHDGIKAYPDIAREIAEETGKVFQFKIKGGANPAFFTVNFKDAPSCSFSGESGEADATITMADADFVDLVEGRLDGMSAFMQGKLQIAGDMMAAQAFAPAIQKIREEVEKAGGAGGAGGGASDGGSFPTDIKSAGTFKQIQDGIKAYPDLAREIADETGKVFQFKITGGANPAFFTINFKEAPSCTFSSESGEADATITMADADFVDLVEGRLDGMSAFMQGKLQIAGDMMAAQAFAPAIQKIREHVEKKSKL